MNSEPTSALLSSMISISACGLIYVALMNRYSVLIPQIRSHQLHAFNKTLKGRHLIHTLLRRARLMQWILILLTLSIITFLLGVLQNALILVWGFKPLGLDPLFLFITGICIMLLAMILGLVEIIFSLNTLNE